MQVLILGGNSDIGLAVARKLAKEKGANVYLASRDLDRLEKKAKDLQLRYNVSAKVLPFDAIDFESHPEFYNALNPKPDVVVVAFGILGDQESAQANFSHAKRIIEVNYLGAVSILEVIAEDFEKRKSGTIVAISSVAGERGRKSNYIYGSTKGALSVYLEGLRHRLFKSGVQVVTVLPGFVKTKMTEGLDLPQKLVAGVDDVAEDILSSIKKGKSKIYSKWFWRYIMLVIKNIPERVFLKTNL